MSVFDLLNRVRNAGTPPGSTGFFVQPELLQQKKGTSLKENGPRYSAKQISECLYKIV